MSTVIQHNHYPKLPAFLKDEKMADVMLTAEGKTIKAHKLILALSSKYFEELFTALEDKHPVVVLKDVSVKYLLLILEYIYSGRVDLSPEDVKEFKKVADSLQINVELKDPDDERDESLTQLMSLDFGADASSAKDEEMISLQPTLDDIMESSVASIRSLGSDVNGEPPKKKMKPKKQSVGSQAKFEVPRKKKKIAVMNTTSKDFVNCSFCDKKVKEISRVTHQKYCWKNKNRIVKLHFVRKGIRVANEPLQTHD